MTDYTVINPDRYAAGAVLNNALIGDIAKNVLHNREETPLMEAEEDTSGSEPVYLQAHNKISAEQIVGTWFGQPLYEKSYETIMPVTENRLVIDSTLSCLNIVPRNNWCGNASSGFTRTLRDDGSNISHLELHPYGLEHVASYARNGFLTIQYTKNSENL